MEEPGIIRRERMSNRIPKVLKSALRNPQSAILAGALFFALGIPVQAQQAPRVPIIGFLGAGSSSSSPLRTEVFRQGLRELGYIEGKNVVIEYRWADGKAQAFSDYASEFVRLKADVIFTGSPQATLAVKKVTATIPIVFVGIGDPVATGVVESLARPGGNVTGLATFSPELSGKRLELIKENAPKIASVAVIWNGTSQGHPKVLKQSDDAARLLGITLQPVEMRSADDIAGALQAAFRSRADALTTLSDPLISGQRKRIFEFVDKNRLPAIDPASECVEEGGLMSYAPDYIDQSRRAAVYVDRILKGTKPADLPVEQPKKGEFIINLKTAKQIGLTIPPNVLARADRVMR
jgi:putative ABC transport system substrate-binding protein